MRGLGGFVRSSWDEVNEIVAAANIHTIKKHGPDRIIGFSPIPAMSMVSYAAGSRYLSLIGGVCMSFYDWYCDLPPASPQIVGRADRRAGIGRLVQLQLHHRLGLERAADAHARRALLHRGPLQGHQDGRDHARLLGGREAVRPVAASQAGHRRRARDGDGPRDPQGFYFGEGRARAYFDDYARRYTDLPMLVLLKEHTLADGRMVMVPDRYVRASDFNGKLGQANNPEWKTVAFDALGKVVLPHGAIGFRWGPDGRADAGQWNLEAKEARHGHDVTLQLSLLEGEHPRPDTAAVGFPYFGGIATRTSAHNAQSDVLVRTVPVAAHRARQGGRTARGAGRHGVRPAGGAVRHRPRAAGELAAASFDDDTPYTPAWQESITGVPRDQVDHRRAPVRRQRRQDAGQVDGDHRRRR